MFIKTNETFFAFTVLGAVMFVIALTDKSVYATFLPMSFAFFGIGLASVGNSRKGDKK